MEVTITSKIAILQNFWALALTVNSSFFGSFEIYKQKLESMTEKNCSLSSYSF